MSQVEVPSPITSMEVTSTPRALADSIPPWLYMVLAILSIQAGAALAKQLFDTIGSNAVVLVRIIVSAVIFNVLWRPRWRRYTVRQYALLLMAGANFALMMLSFYAAIQYIPLGISVALAFVGPLGIALLGSRRKIDVLWVILAASGIILMSPLADAHLNPLGVVIALISGICWGSYIVLGKHISQQFAGNQGLALSMAMGVLFALPFGWSGLLHALRDPALLMLALVVAIISSTIPFALQFMAIRRIQPRIYGLLASLEPVAATLIGWLALHEQLDFAKVLGIALVTCAAIATIRNG